MTFGSNVFQTDIWYKAFLIDSLYISLSTNVCILMFLSWFLSSTILLCFISSICNFNSSCFIWNWCFLWALSLLKSLFIFFKLNNSFFISSYCLYLYFYCSNFCVYSNYFCVNTSFLYCSCCSDAMSVSYIFLSFSSALILCSIMDLALSV